MESNPISLFFMEEKKEKNVRSKKKRRITAFSVIEARDDERRTMATRTSGGVDFRR